MDLSRAALTEKRRCTRGDVWRAEQDGDEKVATVEDWKGMDVSLANSVGFEIEEVERRVVTQKAGGQSSVTALVNIAMAEGCIRFAFMLCSVAFLITYTSDCLSAFNIALAGTVNVIFYILIIALVMLVGIISNTLVDVNLSDLPSVKGFVESSVFVWFLGMAFLIVMPVAIGSVKRALLMMRTFAHAFDCS